MGSIPAFLAGRLHFSTPKKTCAQLSSPCLVRHESAERSHEGPKTWNPKAEWTRLKPEQDTKLGYDNEQARIVAAVVLQPFA